MSILCICAIIGTIKQAKSLRKHIQNGEAIIKKFSIYIFPALVVNATQIITKKEKKSNDLLLVTLQIDPKYPDSFLEILQPIDQGNHVRFILHEIGVVYSRKTATSTQYSDIIEFSRTKIY